MRILRSKIKLSVYSSAITIEIALELSHHPILQHLLQSQHLIPILCGGDKIEVFRSFCM